MSPLPGRPRHRLVATAAAALLVAIAGCGASGGPAAPTDQGGGAGPEKTSLRIGVLPIADSAAIPRAEAAGYFDQEGLDVELVPEPSGAAALPLVVNGELDLAYVNWPTVMAATANGIDDFKVVYPGTAAGTGNFVLQVKPDSGIRTPRDLTGKRIAINTFKSINEILLRSALQAAGTDPNSVQLVDLAFPDMLPALQKDQIDAYVAVEPFITQAARQAGAVDLLDVASGPTAGIPTSGGATTAEWATDNPKTLAAVQRALTRATADLGDRKTVEQTLLTYTKIDAAAAAQISLPDYLSSLDTAGLQRMADLLQQYGVLPKPVDVAPLLDELN